MKAILCGIGKVAKEYLAGYEIQKDSIVCLVDKNPDREGLPAELEGIPFISWDDLAACDTYLKAADCFVICTPKYAHKIFDQIKRYFSGQINAINVISINAFVYLEEWRGILSPETKFVRQVIAPVPAECLKGARVLACREDALPEIPKGGIAAEIGVAVGYFSRKILDVIRPEKFYAVDLFPDEIEEFWGTHFGEKRHFGWYREAFSREIDSGVLEMKRGISWDVMEEFPDDYFDYVYLDAGHDYVSVKKDVEVLTRKVKNGGIIQFNDYAVYDYKDKVPYGIVPVVNQLLRDTGSEVLYYCLSVHGFDDIVIRLKK